MKRVWRITGICLLIWGSLLVLLALIWYKGIFKGHFTFFDDSLEWLQMDKMGHFFASFQVSRWFIQILRWQKVEASQAEKVGVWGGMIFVSPIEILDGFSFAYGFSWSDLLANLAGSLFLWVQLKWMKSIEFMPKFSFQFSPFAVLRKEMLGSYLLSQLMKDYNGHTYWISFSPNVFLKRKFFPPWLLISIGYGADGLLGGHDNVWEKEGQVIDFSTVSRLRQVYVSLDISLQHLHFESRAMKFVRMALSCLKFPFPAVSWRSDGGLGFKWLGF